MLSNRTLNEVKGGYSHYGFRNELLDRLVEALAGAARDQRPPAHHVHGLQHRRQRQLSRGIETRRCGSSARRFHVLLRRARPPRPEGWRGIRAALRGQRELQRCAAARSIASNGIIPADASSRRCSRIPFNADTWNLAALSPYTRTYTIGIGEFPLPVCAAEVRGMGPGRLAHCEQADAESRVRYDLSFNAWANEVGVRAVLPMPDVRTTRTTFSRGSGLPIS